MTPANQRQLPYFQRAALIVSDIDQSLQVYQHTLGFELEFIGIDTPDSYSYEIFKIDHSIQTRFATLSSESQQRTLALIEVPNQKLYTENQLRTSAIVIQTNDLELLKAKLENLNLKTCRMVRHDNPAKGPARLEMAFYDFDLHPVVIYQLL
jgi:hypothetical protein